jgi:hypothetical protein
MDQCDAKAYVQNSIVQLCDRMSLDCDVHDLVQWTIELVKQVQMHWHTHTCKKGGRSGDRWDCRMGYDRLLVEITMQVATSSPTFLLKRDCGRLVPYVLGLMMACPGNHTMSLTCEESRWMRDHRLWHDLNREQGTSVSYPEGCHSLYLFMLSMP